MTESQQEPFFIGLASGLVQHQVAHFEGFVEAEVLDLHLGVHLVRPQLAAEVVLALVAGEGLADGVVVFTILARLYRVHRLTGRKVAVNVFLGLLALAMEVVHQDLDALTGIDQLGCLLLLLMPLGVEKGYDVGVLVTALPHFFPSADPECRLVFAAVKQARSLVFAAAGFGVVPGDLGGSAVFELVGDHCGYP
jgi:hypothetical protein